MLDNCLHFCKRRRQPKRGEDSLHVIFLFVLFWEKLMHDFLRKYVFRDYFLLWEAQPFINDTNSLS